MYIYFTLLDVNIIKNFIEIVFDHPSTVLTTMLLIGGALSDNKVY